MSPSRFYKFSADFIHGGSLLSSDIIEIDDTYITIKQKKNPFSPIRYISIPLRNVVNVEVKKIGVGASVFIKSYSRSQIFCKGLSMKNADKIKQLVLG